jgi:hypothetical protein
VPHGAGICFMAFWLINLAVILKGIEYIRFLQGISAPSCWSGFAVAGLGLCAGGGLWTDAFRTVALHQLFGISEVSGSPP